MHYHLAGTLTVRDAKQHLPHPFAVPEGMEHLSIDFACTPAAAQGLDNMLTLTLFDPHGFRGARHRGGSQHTVQIGPSAATPGYLCGPLPAGEWIVQIDTHRIVPGAPVHYTLGITLEGAERVTAHNSPASANVQRRPSRPAGWFRGAQGQAGTAETCTATPTTLMLVLAPSPTSALLLKTPASTFYLSPTTTRRPALSQWRRWRQAICWWPAAWN